MARGESSDLMMKIIDLHGKPIPAESTTKLLMNSSNELLAGFDKALEAKGLIEIDRFRFNAGDKTTGLDQKGGQNLGKLPGQQSIPVARAASSRIPGQNPVRQGHPGELQPVTFTRDIDAASTRLIRDCINCNSYKRITVIKRKASGGACAGEVFLRLDFIGVLLTEVDWSNDDEVQENCTFICRSVCVSYKPQLPNGTLGARISGFFSMLGSEQKEPPLE
jgi:type VI protein secretion system component Hcp